MKEIELTVTLEYDELEIPELFRNQVKDFCEEHYFREDEPEKLFEFMKENGMIFLTAFHPVSGEIGCYVPAIFQVHYVGEVKNERN